jgi:signal transduction histidine kinase
MSPYAAIVPPRPDRRVASWVPLLRSDLGAEAAIALPITAFACFGVWAELRYATGPVPWAPGGYLLTVAAGSSLLARRSRPLPAALLCMAAIAGYHFAGYPGLAPAVLIFPVCYTLGAYAPRLGLLLGLLAAGAVWLLLTLPPHPLPWYALDVSMPALAYGAAAVVGESGRRRRLEHEERVRQETVAAEARLGRRMAEERLRIARELHDVLAHTVSVVAVQSSVALDALDAVPPEAAEAREAMRLVRGAARQALPELRAALELLRAGAEAPGQSLPQPGLAQLPALVSQLSGSGLAVKLEMGERDAELPPLAQLTAYRIVQEALTNTLRHAHARHATVRLTRCEDRLVVEVADDGLGSSASGGVGGFGIRGMRERAEALGGRFDAGPLPGRGFMVRAELPGELP